MPKKNNKVTCFKLLEYNIWEEENKTQTQEFKFEVQNGETKEYDFLPKGQKSYCTLTVLFNGWAMEHWADKKGTAQRFYYGMINAPYGNEIKIRTTFQKLMTEDPKIIYRDGANVKSLVLGVDSKPHNTVGAYLTEFKGDIQKFHYYVDGKNITNQVAGWIEGIKFPDNPHLWDNDQRLAFFQQWA